MAVYIDNALIQATVGRVTSNWSHLLADTHDELVEFAEALGMRRSWIQYPHSWKEHFDLTEGKRWQAIKRGAIAIEAGGDEWARLTNRKRAVLGMTQIGARRNHTTATIVELI